MNIELIFNAIASGGVILSVIFLAYQIRKNTQAVKANYYDSLNNTNMEYLRQMVEHPHLGALMEEAVNSWEKLNEDDRRTTNFLFIQLFRHWENMFYQNRMSVLDHSLWESHENTMIGYFYHPGTQEWWKHRKMAFSKYFQTFLEGTEKPKEIYKTIKDLSDDP